MARPFPLLLVTADFSAGPPNVPTGVNTVALNGGPAAVKTAVRQISISRGRQYELNKAEAGTMTLDVTDGSEWLNPVNAASGTNILANGSFESGTTGWSGHNASTITAALGGSVGLYACVITSTTAATATGVISDIAPGITAGTSYTVAADFLPLGVGLTAGLGINWFSPTAYLSTSFTSPGVAPSGSGVSTFAMSAAAPATATRAQVFLDGGNLVSGAQFAVDNVVLYSGPTKPTFGSPFNTGPNSLLPYRCIAAGAWWNTATRDATGNLLNSANQPPASGGTFFDPSFEGGGAGGWGNFGSAATLANSTAQAFVGTHSLACTFTATSDVAGFGLWTVPGIVYTVSLYVFVPAGHTVTATLYNYPGLLGQPIAAATSTATGAWQRLTLTGMPAGAVSAVQVQVVSGAFPATVYVDAVQAELGAAVSAFTTAGPTYFPIYTGYVERYPQKWDNAGFRGLKPLEAVDALSPLSRAVINQSYAQTILADGPIAYMPLNDDAGPQAVQRPRGGQPYIGYTELGSQSASVNFGGDSFLDGSKAVSVVQQNTDPATVADGTQLTYLGTRQGGFTMNPKAFSFEAWIKWSSGVVYFGAAAMTPGESTIGEVTGPNHGVNWYTTGGQLFPEYVDPNGNTSHGFGASLASSAWNGYPDGKWHHLVMLMSPTTTISSYVDGVFAGSYSPTGPWSQAVLLNNLFIESQTYFGDPITEIAAANVAAYSFLLTTTQIGNHYQRGIGYLGELPGVRALRLLTKYWSTNVVTDPGKIALSADFYYSPPAGPGQAPQSKSVLSALEDIGDTETGLTWVDAPGKIHFDSRDTRYLNQPTAQFVFGENEAAGELPYLELEYDYDPTYVYSEADLTCDGTQNVSVTVNAATQASAGQRILSKTMYAQNDWDVGQAGAFYTQRYAKPAGAPGTGVPPRISMFTLDPASNPKLFTAVLSLDIGDRVTVKRRTSAQVTMTGDYYVEQINPQIDSEASTWTVGYQLSPVFVPSVWILGDTVKGVLGTTTVPVY